jgi:DNA-binding response OmpR family regulator
MDSDSRLENERQARTATILVVEDELRVRQALRLSLVAQGYRVLEAGDGEKGVAVFSREHPDLVLLDANIPVQDGFEVCQRIRRVSKTPIVMVTVRGAETDIVRALDAGADDYIVKPYAMGELLARMRSILRRSTEGQLNNSRVRGHNAESGKKPNTHTKHANCSCGSPYEPGRELAHEPGTIEEQNPPNTVKNQVPRHR